MKLVVLGCWLCCYGGLRRFGDQTEDIFAALALWPINEEGHVAREVLNGRRKEWQVIRERVVTRCIPKVPFQEHARSLTGLKHRAVGAVLPMRPMGGRGQADALEVRDVTDPVWLTVGRSRFAGDVLAGEHIAAQVHRDGVRPIHSALLAQTPGRPAALDAADYVTEPLVDHGEVGHTTMAQICESGSAECEGVLVTPKRMAKSTCVIGIDDTALTDDNGGIPGQFAEKAVDRGPARVASVHHGIERNPPLGMQALVEIPNGLMAALLLQGIRSPH